MSLTDFVIMPSADYKAICGSVRAKTGKTKKLVSGEIPSLIDGITGGGSGDDVSNEMVVLPETELSFLTEGDGLYVFINTTDYVTFNPVIELVPGTTYTVTWDGEVYECTAFETVFEKMDCVGIGNTAIIGGANTGEPFIIGYMPENKMFASYTTEKGSSHTVKITTPITGGLVKYVTFMNHDGTETLYKKPVVAGDDCVDPVDRGLIEEPTKESTNELNFLYNGWSAEPNGVPDDFILSNITSDKIVYATFTDTIRWYVVNFFDSEDDTTPTRREVTYGSDATNIYIPQKDGYIFTGWNPSVDNVTSGMITIATWEEDQGWLVPMENVATMPANFVRYRSMCYTPDGTKLFVGDANGYVTMYDATTKPYTKIRSVDPSTSSNGITNIAISPDGKLLVVSRFYSHASMKNNVIIYEISGTSLIKKSYADSVSFTDARYPMSVSFNNDGTRLAVTGTMIYIIDTSSTTWSLLKKITPSSTNVYSYARYSADGKKLYYSSSVNASRKIAVYDVENNYADVSDTYFGTVSTNGAGAYVGDVVTTPDNKYVVYGHQKNDASYSVVRYDTLTTPYTSKNIAYYSDVGNVYDLSVSADGSMLAVASDVAPYIHVYDIETGVKLDNPKVQPTVACYACAFSPDGDSLAVGTASGGNPLMLVYQVKK